MCKMTGHVYLVDGGVQNDHAQPGPLKVDTACWEGRRKGRKRGPVPQITLPTRGGGCFCVVTAQLLYHGVL